MEDIEKKLYEHETRIQVLETKCSHQDTRQRAHDDLFEVVLQRVRGLGDKTQSHYLDLSKEIHGAIDKMEERAATGEKRVLGHLWGVAASIIAALLAGIITLAAQ